MRPSFSVITINFNNLKGLKRTFESVQCQTGRKHIEFVVVDGGSTDGSVAFLQENKNHIDTLLIEPDKGIYDAMNKGLNMATGDYVWFVNSGDSIRDEKVTENLLPLLSENPDVIFGDTMFIDTEGHDLGLISDLKPQGFPKKLDSRSFRFGMNICHQSFLVKRSLAPPYDLKYRQAADIDWIVRILKFNPSNSRATFVISNFETGGSSYQNASKAWKERYRVLAEHYGAFPNMFNHLWIFARRFLFNLKSKPKV
jgi:glycosyltransferase involved in cell wall biosynthesis